MRMLVKFLLVCSVIFSNYGNAASSLLPASTLYPFSDSLLKNSRLNHSLPSEHKKVGFIQKLHYKLLHLRGKDKTLKMDEGELPKRNVLSTISLILGIIGAVSLFIPAIAGVAFIAGLAALVTGIIALGKRRNNTKASRTIAIIGLVLGAIIILLGIIGLILLVAFFSGSGW